VPTRNTGTPRISVITPLFNCLAATQEMVATLRASMPRNVSYEIILVDDGSTDGTREWVTGLGEPFQVVLNESNMGFGAATNNGAAVARGEIFALLNNDLILQRGWLEPMLGALEYLGSRAGLIGNVQLNATSHHVDHAGIWVTLNGKPEHIRDEPGIASLVFQPVREVFAVTGACVLVRAATWRQLGGFDEAYINGCEDVDLCVRARKLGLSNAVALRSRVLHHVSSSPGRKLRDEENTRRLILMWRGEFAMESSRLWAWDHFCSLLPEPRDFPDTGEALHMALYMVRMWDTPPATALQLAYSAIDVELARWSKMFSH
jgi:O-antigen biosynthesis protein